MRPDILHPHSPVLNALPAIRVGRKLGLPVVYEMRASWEDAAVDHGTTRRRQPALPAVPRARNLRAAPRRSRHDHLRGPARRHRRARHSRRKGHGHSQCRRCRELSLRRRARTRRCAQQLGLDGAVVLGFAGSFYGYEGLDLLLDAVPAIAADAPVAARPAGRWRPAGGGAARRRLQRSGSPIASIFTGRVPHAEVQRYYDLIDVLVYPRQSMRLTELVTPLKPLEAMAQGRLLVASDVGGHRELIRDGETGVLFRAGDADALAAAIRRLLASATHWDRMRRAGRALRRERADLGAAASRAIATSIARCRCPTCAATRLRSIAGRPDDHVRHLRHHRSRRRAGRSGAAGGHGRHHAPPRPRRRWAARRRPAAPSACAAVDHRPGRWPPAADQRGRNAVAGLQRRNLQLPRAARRAGQRPAIASRPAPTAK